MNRFVLAAALTLTAAAPALANTQLADSLGVDANDYTLSQLIQLDAAVEEGNWHQVRFIKQNAGSDTVSASTMGGSTASGASQFELDLGVEPGSLSLPQLIALSAAEQDGDYARANFIREQANSSGARSSSMGGSVSGGTAQLETALNVEPGVYTLPELIKMSASVD